jgi:hypothetical protein
MLCENQQTLTSNEVTTVSEVEAQPGINDPGFKCVPNSYFKEDCNSCRCDKTGSFARCTLKACPPQQRVKRSPSEESSEIKIFKINNHVPKKFIASKDDLNFRKTKFDVCTIGNFKSEGCKICECVETATWKCAAFPCGGSSQQTTTETPRVLHKVLVKELECIPGVSKNFGNCRCLESGVWDCSYNLLDVPRLKRTKICKDLENNCCQGNLSPVPLELEITKELSTSNEDKLYIDTLSIKPVTTEKIVPATEVPAIDSADSGDVFTPEETESENFECKPNLTFKIECNTCWCRKDGKGPKYCTRIACHPKTYKPLF